MRPIDADALIEKCGGWYVDECTESGFIGTLENLLATEPTIQPQSTTGQLNDGAQSTARSTDLIERQAAIDAINHICPVDTEYDCTLLDRVDVRCVLSDLPSVRPVATDTNVGDTISRQAAIDIGRNATVDTNPSHFEAHQKFTQFMDDAEVSSFGRWQWANGFNTALTAVGIDLKKLPTAQPEPHEGYWIDKGDDGDWAWQIDGQGNTWHVWECSECGKSVFAKSSYCPHCGAKMKGAQNG